MQKSTAIVGGVVALVSSAGVASAATIEFGTYELFNHPLGGENPPPYGLRLDELFDATAGHDIFTFDFDHDESAMFLTYGEDMGGNEFIRIYGQAYGGRDIGTEYADDVYQGVYEIDFLYDSGVKLVDGDDDLEVRDFDASNTGTITVPADAGGAVIPLWDKHAGHNSFRLGDEDDNLGHRGVPGISGWGWLYHGSPTDYSQYSDWLFTMSSDPVPTPGTVVMAGLGLLACSSRRGSRG